MEIESSDGRPFMALVATTVTAGVKEATVSCAGAWAHACVRGEQARQLTGRWRWSITRERGNGWRH
jgi:hypothetical protein